MMNVEDLNGISLFKDFSQDRLKIFLATFKHINYKKGEFIFKEGDEGDTFFIIASGRVSIEKSMDKAGRKFKPLAVLERGDFFGEMAVLEKQPRFAQSSAVTDATLYELDRNKLLEFIKTYPEAGASLLIEIVRVILRRLQNTSNEVMMLHGFMEVLARCKQK